MFNFYMEILRMNKLSGRLHDMIRLIQLSIRLQMGERHRLIIPALLIWPGIHILFFTFGWRVTGFVEADAQNFLIGFPLYCLAAGMGGRIIANDLEQRTLEVAYTVPDGNYRVWSSKLYGAILLLVLSEAALAILSAVFLVSIDLYAVLGAFKGALFYLVLGMMLGALFKNELTAIIITLLLCALNLGWTGSRWSPLFNPLTLTGMSNSDVYHQAMQNYQGYLLLTVILLLFSFSLVGKRESMLGG